MPTAEPGFAHSQQATVRALNKFPLQDQCRARSSAHRSLPTTSTVVWLARHQVRSVQLAAAEGAHSRRDVLKTFLLRGWLFRAPLEAGFALVLRARPYRPPISPVQTRKSSGEAAKDLPSLC